MQKLVTIPDCSSNCRGGVTVTKVIHCVECNRKKFMTNDN